MSYTASVVGGSGFTGGELLRVLAGHPEFEVAQATSRSKENKTVGNAHPNLRDLDLRFTDPGELETVDVLFASEDDATAVLGQSGQAKEIAPTVAAEWDFRMVVLTRSEYGALVYHDGVIHDRDAIETEAVDATGQHDAFVGAFLAKLLEGDGPGEALSTAVATAALTRTIPGPLTTIDRAEVEGLVESVDGSGR